MDHFIRTPFFPPQASERAFGYDLLFWTITALTLFFSVAVGIAVLFFVIRYRAGNEVNRKGAVSHSTILEMLWTIPPLFLALGIFAWSARNFIEYRKIPKDGTEIFVIGKQWMWHLEHMNGIRENNELHVPVGVPVVMTMISQDVIHAMYLPEMRAQYHVVPGRYTRLTFTPVMTGTFHMLCAMHCGTQHSEMVGKIIVMSKMDYEKWLRNGGKGDTEIPISVEASGQKLFNQKGCANCHVDHDTVKAPSLVNIFGTEREMTDGSKEKVDEDYLRDKIVHPWRVVTKGYGLTMPAYPELTEEQILDLVKYTKGLTGSKGSTTMPSSRDASQTTMAPASRGNATTEANDDVSAGEAQWRKRENR